MERTFVLNSEGKLQALVALLVEHWRAHAARGEAIIVDLSTSELERTLAQNRRYFGQAVLGAIEQQAWVGGRQFDKETWHELFKRRFIGLIELPDGSVAGRSSRLLNPKKFAEFMTAVEAYAATELGVQFDTDI